MATKRKTWKNGDKFKVKGAVAVSYYQPNTVYVVNGVNGASVCGMTEDTNQNIGQWVATSQIKRLENTKEELEAEKADLLARVAEVDAKLAYMAENNLTEYDEHQFKVYQALTVIEQTTDKFERSQKLAELLKDL